VLFIVPYKPWHWLEIRLGKLWCRRIEIRIALLLVGIFASEWFIFSATTLTVFQIGHLSHLAHAQCALSSSSFPAPLAFNYSVNSLTLIR